MDAALFKQVMRRYATGVMVLTVRDGDGLHAVTVNSVTSVSLEPVLLLVCLEQNARSHTLVHAAGAFVLNILAEQQAALGQVFAYDRAARSAPLDFAAVESMTDGGVVLDGSLGWIDCRVVAEYPGGDHTIFLAEVLSAAVAPTSSSPLIYYETHWLGLPEP